MGQNNLIYGGLIGIGVVLVQPFAADRHIRPCC